MADARAMALPLVTFGDPEFVTHDWHAIFSTIGLLDYATKIAGLVRFIGWTGMILIPCWLAWQLPYFHTVRKPLTKRVEPHSSER